MSFLLGGRPQPSSAEKVAAVELEFDMISDMLDRLKTSCFKKCIPPEYRESDLNKGESVCLDRCVAKFFDVNMKVSEKMQADAALRQGAAAGSGGFGS